MSSESSDTDQSLSADDGLDEVDGPSQTNVDTQQKERLLESTAILESAIRCGNVDVAVEMAEFLARVRAALTAESPFIPSSADISVKIYIEDKQMSAGCIVWKLQPTITIQALKWKMYEKHSFPPDVQKWIIGRRLASDLDTLADCGVTEDGSAVYLYLLTAADQPVTLTDINDSPTWTSTLLTGLVPSPSTGPARTLTTPTGLTLAPPTGPARTLTPPTGLTPPTQLKTKLSVQLAPETTNKGNRLDDVGWHCPECTFVNEPTRPGCEVCTASRPAGYKPPAWYQPSDRERRRIEEEAKLEDVSTWQEDTLMSILADVVAVTIPYSITATDNNNIL